jgi:hypothetical protein
LENDHATDFLAKLRESPGIEFVRSALLARETMADEERARAAAAVIAAACDSESVPFHWAHFLAQDDDLRRLAQTTAEAIRVDSETRRLWAESGELDEWLAAVDDLLRRLSI